MSQDQEVPDLPPGAAPALTTPPSRIARIAAGVTRARQRSRLTSTTAAAAAVLVVVGGAAVFAFRGMTPAGRTPVAAPTSPVGGTGSAAASASTASRVDSPACDNRGRAIGRPVLPALAAGRGPAAITLCVVGGSLFDATQSWYDDHPARTLYAHLAEMAAALANPPRLSCTADDLWPSMWFRYYFVVGYPDRSQRLLEPPICERAGGPVDTFLRLYRAQLTVDPAGVASPHCAADYRPDQLTTMTVSGDPADGIAVNRGDELAIDRSAQLFLPSALAAATVCRYTRAGNQFTLASSSPVRDGIDPLRDALNGAYRPPQPAWDEPLQYFRQPPCPHVPPANRALTVVLVADVTAARSEIRVYAAPPCSAVQNGLGVFAGIDPGLAGWLSTVGK